MLGGCTCPLFQGLVFLRDSLRLRYFCVKADEISSNSKDVKSGFTLFEKVLWRLQVYPSQIRFRLLPAQTVFDHLWISLHVFNRI